jgi:hypothetical protein
VEVIRPVAEQPVVAEVVRAVVEEAVVEVVDLQFDLWNLLKCKSSYSIIQNILILMIKSD